MSKSITHPSILGALVVATLSFVFLQFWNNILLVIFVHLLDLPNVSFKSIWDAVLYGFVNVPSDLFFLIVLAFCATIATLQLALSIAQFPFTNAGHERTHRAIYYATSFFTSCLLTALSGKFTSCRRRVTNAADNDNTRRRTLGLQPVAHEPTRINRHSSGV